MIKETLSFHFGLPRGGAEGLASEMFSKEFSRSLGWEDPVGCRASVELNSPEFAEFYEALKYHREKSDADFIGPCFLDQEFLPPAGEAEEWYELVPRNSIFGFISPAAVQGVPVKGVRADRIPRGVHLGAGEFGNPCCDETFRRFCLDKGLRGVDFLWMPDQSRFKAKQWFVLVADAPLGRGCDHPWFDPDTLKGSDSWQPENPLWRTGVFHFHRDQIRADALFSRDQGKLLSLFAKTEASLTIRSHRRVLRDELPQADFAFNWRAEDFTRRGTMLKQRGLCLSGRARALLMEEGFISGDETTAIAIGGPSSVPVGRANAPFPQPLYSREERLSISRELGALQKRHLLKDLPEKEVSLEKALTLLEKEKHARPRDFEPGLAEGNAGEGEGSPGPLKGLPGEYRRILSLANGGRLDPECALLPIEEIPSKTAEIEEVLAEAGEPQEGKRFVIAESVNGDWYALDAAEERRGRVSRISHETCLSEYVWENPAEFLYDMLTGFYEE